MRRANLKAIAGGAILTVALGAPLPSDAEGLRVPGSDFGVAAPDMDLARLLRPAGDDGDMLTIGRSSQRYALFDRGLWQAGVGVSTWEVSRGAQSLYADRGYVPLLHAFGEYRFWRSFRLSGDVDALGGVQGRGLDAGMRLSYDLNPAWSISAGYRVHHDGNELRFDAVDQGRVTLGTRLRF